jgi:cell division transport system permease protein
MRALDHALRIGWATLWRSRGSSAFAIVAIALAMIVLGAILLITANLEQVLERWTSAAEFSVYLDDDATSEERGAIEAQIDRSGVTAGRDYVSKADALSRFRSQFAELAPLTEGFEDNPFPASVEVRLRPEVEADDRVEALVRSLAGSPGVADVRYDQEWLDRIASGLRTVRLAGFALAALMTLAAGVTVATVVRLGLHARRAELEIMELVGAPLAYIRGPFVAEGLLQGGIGAVLAVLALGAGYAALVAAWGAPLGALLGGEPRFLPPGLVALLIVGGMAVGASGGLAASRHAAGRS